MPAPTWPAARAEMPIMAGMRTWICIVILVITLLCHLNTYKKTSPSARLRTALMSSHVAALLINSDMLKSPGSSWSFAAKRL